MLMVDGMMRENGEIKHIRWISKVGLICAAGFLSVGSGGQSEKQSSSAVLNEKRVPPASVSAYIPGVDILDRDTRLNTLVSLSSDKMTMANAVKKLRALTKLPFGVEGRQAQDYSIAFYFKNARLADVLDSLAAVRDFAWTKQPSGQWTLWEPYNPRIWKIWPNNFTPEQLEIEALGDQFLRLYRQLPSPLQIRLCDEKAEGAAFQDLPTPLQVNIRAMLEREEQSLMRTFKTDPRFKGNEFHFEPLGYGPETKVIFYHEGNETRPEWMPRHRISVTGNYDGTLNAHLRGKKTSRMAAFFEYAENIVTPMAAPVLLDHTAEDSASRQAGAAKDARLSQKYTLEIRSATLSEALLKLSALAHVNFAAEYWNWNWETQNENEKHSLSLKDTTLQDNYGSPGVGVPLFMVLASERGVRLASCFSALRVALITWAWIYEGGVWKFWRRKTESSWRWTWTTPNAPPTW